MINKDQLQIPGVQQCEESSLVKWMGELMVFSTVLVSNLQDNRVVGLLLVGKHLAAGQGPSSSTNVREESWQNCSNVHKI